MFERPSIGEHAILVHLDFGPGHDADSLSEFRELVRSAGGDPLATVTGSRQKPHPRFFVGTGKADEVREAVEAHGAGLVVVNHALTPSQERNLERHLKCRVLDRVGLILDIFAQRAHSHEGKLQVELAQLRHLSTRLVRGWTHLERQKGGIGLRGPGETQLETDRRLLGDRIKMLQRKLDKVDRQRFQGRRNRRRHEVSVVSLVGYTNTGKSTLFNRLTGAGVMSQNQLFATLDPTVRRVDLPEVAPIVLADTVGFIKDLPHDLVAAFKSTLEETREADILLHVIDESDPRKRDRIDTVNEVLAEIDADKVPQLEVFNKIDLSGTGPAVEYGDDGLARRAWISAQTGEGVDRLLEEINRYFKQGMIRGWLSLNPAQGRARAKLFDLGAVREEQFNEAGGWDLQIELSRNDYQQLCSHENIAEERLRA